MAVKITTTFDIDRRVRGIARSFQKLGCDVYEKEIIRSIKLGKSPVRKGRWDRPYLPSYVKAIRQNPLFRALAKRQSPVNLKLSGQLLKTLSCDPKGFSDLAISFNDKLADIHDRQGVPSNSGKRIRRMLPTRNGEEFNAKITLEIQRLLNRIAKKFTSN